VPDQFTPARTAAATAARRRGDAEAAQAITALRKPTVVGWLANQLCREYPDEIAALLDLGVALRAATAELDGEQLRTLAGRQRQVIFALVQQGRALGNAAGRKVSEDTARGLEETLYAVLADAGAADQFAAGRLTDGLSRSGFPAAAASLASSLAAPLPRGSGASGHGGVSGRSEDRIAAAQLDEKRARAAADASEDKKHSALQALEGIEVVAADMQGRIDDLKRQLEAAGKELLDVDRRLWTARRDYERADKAAREAHRRLADATDRLDRLTADGVQQRGE
jgi:hypothetical protein